MLIDLPLMGRTARAGYHQHDNGKEKHEWTSGSAEVSSFCICSTQARKARNPESQTIKVTINSLNYTH